MNQLVTRSLRLVVTALPLCLLVGARAPSASMSREASGPPATVATATFQGELLDVAFDTASAIPVDPHVKDRSRAQEAVVAAWLTLDQPQEALRCANGIDNWRRGAAYADIAFHQAGRARMETVEPLLDLAAAISETTEDWRRDRVRVKIAMVDVLLGREERAAELEADVVASEIGKTDAVRASIATDEAFDQRMDAIDAAVANGNFDLIRNALDAGVRLFARFYDDDRRSHAEAKIKSSWRKLPVTIRIELLMDLAGAALQADDRPKALELVNEAGAIMDGSRWMAEHRVPLAARLAGLRGRAGDIEGARRDAAAALALFDAGRQTIPNFARAGALRPVAEAYQAMGDPESALAVYRRAIEEGATNENARPRGLDLSATCGSMAIAAVEPDPALWARIREIHDRLGAPW